MKLNHPDAVATSILTIVLTSAVPAWAADYTYATGNYLPGITAPDPLTIGDSLQINSGGYKYFNGVTFNNQGLVDWNADALYLQYGAAINNSGVWNAHGDFSLVNNGGDTPTFTNSGTFRKSGGAGATTIGSIAFVNSGILDAQVGTLTFSGNNATFNSGTQFTGAGINRIASNATFNGSFTSANLLLDAGIFTGTGAIANGSVAYEGGSITGSWTLAAGQSLTARNGGYKYLSSATFANLGTFNWDTTNSLYLQNGTVFTNTGTFAFLKDATLVDNGGTTPQFINNGTLSVVAGKAATIGAFEFINNATIEVAGTLNLNGHNATFNSGSQFTGAGVVAVNSNATFNGNITASPTLSFRAGIFTGAGGFTIGGNPEYTGGTITGSWTLASGQALTGRTGGHKYLSDVTFANLGTFNWDTTNSLYLQNGTVFTNTGTFAFLENATLVDNAGTTPQFINDGTLSVATGKTATIGSIAFVNNATIEVAGTLNLNGHNATFNSGSQFTGAGVVAVNSNATFNGNITASPTLSFRAGTFTGASGFTIGGNPEYTGGTITGSWTLASGQALTARTGGFKYLSSATFANLGTFNWDTTNSLYLQNGTVFTNTGTFAFLENATLVDNAGTTPQFINNGTLSVATGKTAAIGSIAFVNNATIDVAGTLNLNGGNARFNSGTEFFGSGTTNVNSNAQFVGAIQSDNLRIISGTLTGGDGPATSAELKGDAVYAGGTLTGVWDLSNGLTLDAVSGGFKYLSGATVTNAGTLNWQTTNSLYVQTDSHLANSGTIDFQADSSVVHNGGTIGSFVNTGLIVKSGGTGTTTIGNNLGFTNTGTVEVRTGTIALPTDFSNAGTLMGNGTFSSNAITNNGHVAPGASTGVLSIAGNYVQGSSGVLDIELTSLADFDQLLVSGTTTLAGDLALHCLGACYFNVNDQVTILNGVGNLLGSFTNISYFGFGTGEFEVLYDLTNEDVILRALTATAPVPVPAAAWLLLSALGVLGARTRRRAIG